MLDEEILILRNLQTNESYTRKVIPFLKPEYFTDDVSKNYFKVVEEFFGKHNTVPNKAAVDIELSELVVSENVYKELIETSEKIGKDSSQKENMEWLVEKTEKFCKNRAMHIALMECVTIMDNLDDQKGINLTATAMPDIMSKALAISFDTSVGHDYVDDMDDRYILYTTKAAKIPFRLQALNDMTKGGAERKTLNVVSAPTGEGKSILLCDLAANYMRLGFSVLYITLELAEWKVGQRIDANLMNTSLDDFETLPKTVWDQKAKGARSLCTGKLKIKEYPAGGASCSNFRFLIQELKQKQNFIPDVIMIDYIGICGSSRIKNRSDMYLYTKSVAEEMRALMVENNCVGWSASQVNRSGYNNSEIDITNTAESMGGPATFDFMVALIPSPELDALGQIMVKQLKNRYADKRKDGIVILGLNRSKMKFYDVNIPSGTVSSSIAPSPNKNTNPKPTNQSKFKGIKV